MTPPAIARFDGLAVWSKLTKDQQRDIGSLAVELIVAACAAEQAALQTWHGPVDRANLTASTVVFDLLGQAVSGAVPREAMLGENDFWRVPVSLGPVCRGCGCSEKDACEGGCGWADHDLCTACKARGVS